MTTHESWGWSELDETHEDWNLLLSIVNVVIIAMMPLLYLFIGSDLNDNKLNKMQRIAMISTHGYFDVKPILGRTDTGGQIVYILNLVQALSMNGFKVDIFTRWFDKNTKQIEEISGCNGCRIIRIPCGSWKFIQKEQLYPYLDELCKNMIKFIKHNKLKYNLYHGHYVDAGIVTLNVSEAFQRPSFFTSHSLGAWKKHQMRGDAKVMEKKYNFQKRIYEEQRIFDNVNGVITTSVLEKQKMKELMHYEGDNVSTIPCGVNVHFFKPDLQIKPVKKYVFCLSRIDTNKGHDLLLNAWNIVLKHISDVHLIIGGGSKDPNQRNEREKSVIKKMKSIIKENKMENNVDIIGYVDHYKGLLSYYQQCEFFVVPSLFEPFGITALEAMACRKCVVATKYGGISTIITHEKDGLLVDTTNAHQFAANMIRLLKDDCFKQKLQDNAYKTVHDRYSWNIIADRHVSLYNDVLVSKQCIKHF